MVTGVDLALLNAVVMLDTTAARPVGASTSYPYLADVMAAVTDNDYFRAIQVPGHWELIFLFGSFLAGLVFALWRKDFDRSVS